MADNILDPNIVLRSAFCVLQEFALMETLQESLKYHSLSIGEMQANGGRKVLPTTNLQEQAQHDDTVEANPAGQHTKWTPRCSKACILIAVIQVLIIIATCIFILSRGYPTEISSADTIAVPAPSEAPTVTDENIFNRTVP
jgi:hypothetical protein